MKRCSEWVPILASDIVESVKGFNLEADGHARKGLYKNLHGGTVYSTRSDGVVVVSMIRSHCGHNREQSVV